MTQDIWKKKLLATTLFAGVAGAVFAAPVYAQQNDTTAEEEDEAPTVIEEVDTQDEARQERVVVTGSRLARDEFTSASPLKVLNIEENVAAGLVDAASIVQRTSVAGGTQFDNTFTGQVTDSGPGSATVALRGLDAERTLILMNGRRLAAAGVRGAPTRPDLNLIPLTSIERVDILTDGASSVYGSDAVAGVINFITKREFDGLEIDVFASTPEHGGGEERRASFSTGLTNDRGFAGFGVEYYKRDEVRRGERDFTPCVRDIEENPETGEIRELCYQNTFANMFLDPLNALGLGDVTQDGLGVDFGIYGFDFDDGMGFNLIPSNDQPGGPGSADNGGVGSTWLYDNRYTANIGNDEFDLAQGLTRYSMFTNGEYRIGGLGNSTLFWEGLYANRTQDIYAGSAQIYPSIPCDNPYIQADPTLSNTPICTYGQDILESIGFGDFAQLVWTPFVAEQSGPIEVDVSTIRGVAGLDGDLEWLIPSGQFQFGGDNFGIAANNWTYNTWVSFDHNTGIDRARTLNEERVAASIYTAVEDPTTGEITCGYDELELDLFGFIIAEDCVPLNPTDPSIYLNSSLPEGYLEYASGLSTTTTEIQQQMLQVSATGDIAYLPAGTVPLAFGIEYRKDKIETLNSFFTTSGSGTDGRSEGNTIGDTTLLEFFIETEIPVLKGQPFAEELTFTAAARWTEEQNFGALWTYRIQGLYRPTDWLTGRASFGTTYRAPNLREQFLASQTSGVSAFSDPCIVSNVDAYDDQPDVQDRLIANCIAQGADPTVLGAAAAPSYTQITGGTTALNAETSESLTAGFVVEQPWFDAFDLSLAVTYFDIEIEDSIEEPSVAFILNECLVQSTGLNSPFCQLIDRRDTGDAGRNFIDTVDASFVNVGLISTDGVDLDIRYQQEFPLAGNELILSSNLSASYIAHNRRNLFDIIDSYDGEQNLPRVRGDVQTRAEYRDFALNWNVRYIGETEDDFEEAVRADPFVDLSTGETIFYAGFRDVDYTEEQFLHDFSVQYMQDTWSATFGVRNAFDKEPPLVDVGEGYPESANAVLGGGYDVYGRTLFARFNKSF